MSVELAPRRWRYEAMTSAGIVEGVAEARTELELDGLLQRDGVTLLRARAVARDGRRESLRLSGQDLVTFTTQLATVLGAGVPIVDGMRQLGQRMRAEASRRVVADVVRELENGASLSGAMASRPRSFPPIYRASVEAGEMAGAMPRVLQRLAEHMEWTREIRQTVTQALVYPCILGVAIAGLVVTLVTFLVPRIVKMFPGGVDELPAQTRQILGLSEFLTGNWPALVAGLAAAAVGGFLYTRTAGGRLRLGTALLRLPRLGEVLRMFSTAKFAATAGTLQNAGVPINDVLALGGSACGNARMERSFSDANERVRRGETISQALEAQPYMDPLLLQMVGVGEQAGDLGGCLDKLCRHYDRELPRMVKWMLSFLEPGLLLCGGLVVAYTLFAAFLPLLDMYEKF